MSHFPRLMSRVPQSADRLSEPIQCADVNRDVQTVINVKGSGHNIPEQLLPDFYAEDMTNVMNRERRKKVRPVVKLIGHRRELVVIENC